jgi:putative heme-binding domain-containing protein
MAQLAADPRPHRAPRSAARLTLLRPMGCSFRVLASSLLVCAACLAAHAQTANPFEGDTAAIDAGGVLYASRCPECHGADAKGLSGPDLTRLWTEGASDERVFTTIKQGVPNSIMPPNAAPDNEIWAIVAYLRSISTVPPFDHPAGNAARGRAIFAESCAGCHKVGADGGVLGPDLSRIAEVRSLEALIRAIRDPSDSIAEGFRTVTLVTRDRNRVRGIVKGEDAFSIQIVDVEGRLRAFRKTDLRDILREERSLMSESDGSTLSQQQLDDLLAYLATLRSDHAGA